MAETERRHIMNMTFHMPVQVHYGAGCISACAGSFGKYGKRAIVITDPISFTATGADKDITKVLKEQKIEYTVYDKAESNPTIESARKCAEASKAFQAEFVIAVGGGSSLDTAKAAALLSRQDAPDEELFQTEFTEDVLPILAVPTTSGTGSEVTPYAMLIDGKRGTKNNLKQQTFFSREAFVDPRYTMTMPRSVAVNTSIDAMTHALESIFAKTTNPLVQAIAYESIGTMAKAFPNMLQGALTEEDYGNMALASVMAGMVVSQTRTTILHGASYPLTSHKHIAHGRAMALIIANYMKLTNKYEPDVIDRIMKTMNMKDLDEFCDTIHMLVGDVKPEEKLSPEEMERFTDEVMASHNLQNTRIPVSREDVTAIFQYNSGKDIDKFMLRK